jgi:hypothetical protein
MTDTHRPPYVNCDVCGETAHCPPPDTPEPGPNPLQLRLAAIWDAAMDDSNGMQAAAALAQAYAEYKTTGLDAHHLGWIQNRAIKILLAPGADPGGMWLAVASNTLGAMLRARWADGGVLR